MIELHNLVFFINNQIPIVDITFINTVSMSLFLVTWRGLFYFIQVLLIM